jgi:hypothetical protein
MSAADPLLTGPEAAKRAGVTPGTWRGYVFRGIAPPPDDPDDDRPANRRMPRWLTSTVDHFTENRIGRGKHTRRKRAASPAVIGDTIDGPIVRGDFPEEWREQF